jgi:hypothetical protein
VTPTIGKEPARECDYILISRDIGKLYSGNRGCGGEEALVCRSPDHFVRCSTKYRKRQRIESRGSNKEGMWNSQKELRSRSASGYASQTGDVLVRDRSDGCLYEVNSCVENLAVVQEMS